MTSPMNTIPSTMPATVSSQAERGLGWTVPRNRERAVTIPVVRFVPGVEGGRGVPPDRDALICSGSIPSCT